MDVANKGEPQNKNLITPKQCHKNYVKAKIDNTQPNRKCRL